MNQRQFFLTRLLLAALIIVAVCAFLPASILANVPVDTTKKGNFFILDPKTVPLREVGKLPKILREASGLEITRSGYLWSHNDDGIPALYCIDSLGKLVRAVQLNVSNRGWEDLAQDDEGNIYIGGFGNNKNDKKDLRIYKIPNPESIQANLTTPETISYRYGDQKSFPPDPTNRNYDVDAFFAWDKHLYLFTKNRSNPFKGYSRVYRLTQEPGEQIAELIDSVFVGDGPMLNNWVTSVDISPDKKKLALLLHDRVLFLTGFTKENFSNTKVFELNLENYSHKAGLCFVNEEKLYIVDELEFDFLGGKLYALDLKPVSKKISP